MAIIFRLHTLVTAIANINLFISDTFVSRTKKLISLDLFFPYRNNTKRLNMQNVVDDFFH